MSGASANWDAIEPFFRGVSRNKSIREIEFSLEGEMHTMLGPFFQNNHNLTSITISHCVWGDEGGGRLFSLALGSSTNKLKEVHL